MANVIFGTYNICNISAIGKLSSYTYLCLVLGLGSAEHETSGRDVIQCAGPYIKSGSRLSVTVGYSITNASVLRVSTCCIYTISIRDLIVAMSFNLV